MIYLKLYWTFFQIGLFAIGGGAATIPFLSELTQTTDWFTMAELTNMIAVSESTPGAIGINMSTYAGFMAADLLGGIIATFGLITPSIIIIVIISMFLDDFKDSKQVKNIFYGLRPASCALILVACYSVFTVAIFNPDLYALTGNYLDYFNLKNILLGVILLLMMFKLKWHPIFFILISAIIGIAFNFYA